MKPHPSHPKLLFLLDYDGTLTDFKADPEKSHITPAIRRLLTDLRKKYPVILVSGRYVEGLERVSGLRNFPMVGTHGFEAKRLPGGLQLSSPALQKRFKKEAARFYQGLLALKSRYPGIHIEKKPFSSTLHYRGAGLSAVQTRELYAQFVSIFRKNVTVRFWALQEGKKMFEAMPRGFSKGKAVQKITEKLPGFLPIYAGDDKTDMTVFKVLGRKGLKIAVGDRIPDGLCDMRLESPQQFLAWLGSFVD